ncbi:MAG: hypothetical protein P4L86_03805 [Mycobacterium sp.]|nr:hypothetical protein [Mycobacterium sp.]
MKMMSGFAQQTLGRFVLAGGLVVAALVSPIAWSFGHDSAASPQTVVASHSGIGQVQWLDDIQPHAQAPHVDTSVHQSR